MAIFKLPFIGKPTGEGDKELLTFVNRAKDYALAARLPYEDYWFTCLAFLAGNHWEYWMHDVSQALGRRIIPAAGLEDKCRLTDDRISTYCTQVRANLVNSLPSFEAVPAPPMSPQEVEEARRATTALRWRETADREFELRDREIGWLLATSEAYRLTLYDADAGENGDIRTEVVDAFRCAKDPRAVDGIWPPRFFIHYDALDVDDIFEKFGVKVQPETIATTMKYFDRLAQNVIAHRAGSSDKGKTAAIVWRLYSPPSQDYPKGQEIDWCGQQPLDRHELQGGTWPWAKHEWSPVPGRLYGRSWVELLLQDQKDLNVKRSIIAEMDKRRLRGDMVVTGGFPKQLELEDGRKVIKLQAGARYAWETYLAFNLAEARSACSDVVQYMKEKGGVNDSTLGKLPPSGMTATVFSMVKEADLMRLSYPMRRYSELGLCDIMRQKLALMSKFFVTTRMMNMAVLGASTDSSKFRGADMGKTIDVIVVPVPHLTPAEERHARDEAGQRGLYGPWDTPAHQYSCRIELRARGLLDDEEALARIHGSLEIVGQRAGIFQQAFDELQMVKLLKELDALEAPPPLPLAAMDGAGGQAALPAPQPMSGALPPGPTAVAPLQPPVMVG